MTAKTITRQAAEDALARLRVHSTSCGTPLRLKTITLTAKDKICPLEERVCTPEACPRADGYYDRINAALYSFLSQTDEFTARISRHLPCKSSCVPSSWRST